MSERFNFFHTRFYTPVYEKRHKTKPKEANGDYYIERAKNKFWIILIFNLIGISASDLSNFKTHLI